MRLIRLACLALAALVLTAPPASAAPPFILKSAKKKHGPFTEATTSRPLSVAGAQPKSVYFKAVSNGNSHEVTLLDAGEEDDPEGFQVRWFRKRQDISHDVQTAGYDFTLKFGKPVVFRAHVKNVGSGPAFCLGGQVGAPYVGQYFEVNGEDGCD